MSIVTLWELYNDDSPIPAPIIDDGILLDKTMLMIIGAPKNKKTFLAWNIAIALARGEGFACFKVKEEKRVLILSAEGGKFQMRDRLRTMITNPNENVLSNVSYSNKLIFDLNNEESFQHLIDQVQTEKPEVIILDPLIRFISEDENSSVKIGQVFQRLRTLIDDFDISLIIVDHTGKDPSKGARGSSVKRSEYDSAIYMHSKDNNSRLSFDMRHIETPDDKHIKFNSETCWFENSEIQNTDYGVLELLRSNPALEKSELASGYMDLYQCSQATAYRHILKSVDSGFINQIEGKYYPTENLN